MAREKISGIYIIENLVNGKVYVGSSVNILARWECHRNRLRHRVNECNRYLYNAWCKYGEDNFRFEIIERGLPKHLLAERESYWINSYDSLASNSGYNIGVDTTCPARGLKPSAEIKNKRLAGIKKYFNTAHIYKKSKFIDPEGNVVVVDCLPKFCNELGLNIHDMQAMSRHAKRPASCFGWRPFSDSEVGIKFNKESRHRFGFGVPKKVYDLVSPAGVRMQGKGITEFCKNNNLHQRYIASLLLGKINSYKGWARYVQTEEDAATLAECGDI